MRSKYLLPLAIVLSAMSACSDDSSDDSGDSGLRDSGVVTTDAGLDASSGTLQPGTYRVSNIVKIEDGCGLTLEDGTLETLPLGNTSRNISLGNYYDTNTDPSFDPPGYALGSGGYTTSTTANLMVNARVEISDGCEFDVQRTTVVTYTGSDMVSVNYTNRESNHTTECGVPSGGCTSRYTFNMTRSGP